MPLWVKLLAVVLFSLGMSGLYSLQRGISQNFGMGLSLGIVLGGVIILFAADWRNRERG